MEAPAAASPTAFALATTQPSLSPAQRLYSDALISVFGFLDLRGLIDAHASCRSWRDAAHKERSRKIQLRCQPSQLAWFCASPLRPHVGDFSSPHDSTCTLEQLASLSAFPSLTRVTIRVDPTSFDQLTAIRGQAGYAEAVAAAVAQWPSRLTHLRVGFFDCDTSVLFGPAQVLLDCIGRLISLTEFALDLLELRQLPDRSEGRLTLQPLLQLTRLQTFKLGEYCIGGYCLGAADCSVLKQLGSLTHLDLDSTEVPLDALCTPPHQLAALQRIDLRGTATAAHMEVLRLPALSTLHVELMDPTAVAHLPRFSQLRTLHLRVRFNATSDFMPHLTQCTQLTALVLQWARFTLVDLAELVRSLTALTSLTLMQSRIAGMDQPASLACLRTLPQLRELNFDFCAGVRLDHLTDAAFTSLSSLRSLSMTMGNRDFPAAHALFALPCKLMPHLTHTCIESQSAVILSRAGSP